MGRDWPGLAGGLSHLRATGRKVQGVAMGQGRCCRRLGFHAGGEKQSGERKKATLWGVCLPGSGGSRAAQGADPMPRRVRVLHMRVAEVTMDWHEAVPGAGRLQGQLAGGPGAPLGPGCPGGSGMVSSWSCRRAGRQQRGQAGESHWDPRSESRRRQVRRGDPRSWTGCRRAEG